ncbi:MAG: hypothetical protein IJ496_05605 [Ruminococcus sp.]|nr:hypothetical protein [Ruminococcus sp.]
MKSNLYPPANGLRFIAAVFGILLCYGSVQKLVDVNMAYSLDHWGNFVTALLLIATPFVMNRFLPIVLFGTGLYTIVHLFQPNLQNWMNLVLFVLLTLLLLQPYRKWLRILIQLACLAVIGVGLWCVWEDFYSGIEHFVETGKLTDAYLKRRIISYLPSDFSYYMAVTALVLSIRQYSIFRKKRRSEKRTQPGRRPHQNEMARHHQDDEDLWGY